MGTGDTESPEYQVGDGCLMDQLIGQYLAQIAGLGSLVSQEHVQATLQSIYKYNYKRSLTITKTCNGRLRSTMKQPWLYVTMPRHTGRAFLSPISRK